MSQIKLSPNASGTGDFIIASPNSNTDVTFNLPTTLGNAPASSVVTTDASGNLGLGVTPSAWYSSYGTKAFQFAASGSLQGLDVSSGDRRVALANNDYINSGGNDIYINTGHATKFQQRQGAFEWYTAASGTAGDTISFTQAMTLDASGNLGIGTSSPGSLLHLSKTLSGSLTSAIQIQNYGTFTWGIGIDNAVSNSSLVFQTGGAGGTTRMTLDSSGNLLVGLTTNEWSGSMRMAVSGSKGLSVSSTGGATSEVMGLWNKADSGTRYQIYFADSAGGTIRGSITTNGSATAYNTSSDYRLKNTIAPMTGALAKVAQLKPVTYKWNADGSDGEGFIAHELAEVVPQAVTGEKDAVDEDGNPKYQGVDTSFLVATLTAAIQELKAENDSLKSRLDAAGL
jgi:hypothetical protein